MEDELCTHVTVFPDKKWSDFYIPILEIFLIFVLNKKNQKFFLREITNDVIDMYFEQR